MARREISGDEGVDSIVLLIEIRLIFSDQLARIPEAARGSLCQTVFAELDPGCLRQEPKQYDNDIRS